MASSSAAPFWLRLSFLSASLLTLGVTRAHALPFEGLGPLLPAVAAHSGGGAHTAQGQGYLGVDIRTVGDVAVRDLHLRETRGVVVIMVDHDGPAWKAGIREHDVVQTVNGAPVDTEEQLRHVLREMQPGRTVQIGVSRDGSVQTLSATMANRDDIGRRAWQQHYVVPAPADPVDAAVDEPLLAPPPPAPAAGKTSRYFGSFMPGHLLPVFPSYTGATVDEIGPQLAEYFGLNGRTGLLIHSIDGNSPAAAAGMHAGDVVLRVNGAVMATRSDWNRALHDSKGHPVSVVVMREHHEQTLTVVPDSKRRGAAQAVPGLPQASSEPHWLAVMLFR
ncbi:PDZ domain-containing protein [Terriglobus aquaticus]|uniref:PDZ domain-containing protein n=1 Tax=Terriglobus aquaticus TaxID=940139 RepID=A0ABW9KPL5_9BACT|nr:PDZ domain-containing protein [Terriglobus aquaticus]